MTTIPPPQLLLLPFTYFCRFPLLQFFLFPRKQKHGRSGGGGEISFWAMNWGGEQQNQQQQPPINWRCSIGSLGPFFFLSVENFLAPQFFTQIIQITSIP
jgi:hypothetical protein